MGIIGSLTITKAVAFDRMCKNYGRLTTAGNRFRISSVNLIGVVTTPIERHNLVISHIFYQLEQLRILAKEMLAGVGAAVVLVVLQLAITDFIHALDKHATLIFL